MGGQELGGVGADHQALFFHVLPADKLGIVEPSPPPVSSVLPNEKGWKPASR